MVHRGVPIASLQPGEALVAQEGHSPTKLTINFTDKNRQPQNYDFLPHQQHHGRPSSASQRAERNVASPIKGGPAGRGKSDMKPHHCSAFPVNEMLTGGAWPQTAAWGGSRPGSARRHAEARPVAYTGFVPTSTRPTTAGGVMTNAARLPVKLPQPRRAAPTLAARKPQTKPPSHSLQLQPQHQPPHAQPHQQQAGAHENRSDELRSSCAEQLGSEILLKPRHQAEQAPQPQPHQEQEPWMPSYTQKATPPTLELRRSLEQKLAKVVFEAEGRFLRVARAAWQMDSQSADVESSLNEDDDAVQEMSHRLFNSLLKELGDLVFSGGLLDGDAAQLLRVRERLGEWYAALPQAARANGATGDADELDLCARLYMQVQLRREPHVLLQQVASVVFSVQAARALRRLHVSHLPRAAREAVLPFEAHLIKASEEMLMKHCAQLMAVWSWDRLEDGGDDSEHGGGVDGNEGAARARSGLASEHVGREGTERSGGGRHAHLRERGDGGAGDARTRGQRVVRDQGQLQAKQIDSSPIQQGVRSVRNAAEAGTDPAARDAGSDADGVSADDAALWANLEQHMQASAAISSLPIDSAAHIADRVQQMTSSCRTRALHCFLRGTETGVEDINSDSVVLTQICSRASDEPLVLALSGSRSAASSCMRDGQLCVVRGESADADEAFRGDQVAEVLGFDAKTDALVLVPLLDVKRSGKRSEKGASCDHDARGMLVAVIHKSQLVQMPPHDVFAWLLLAHNIVLALDALRWTEKHRSAELSSPAASAKTAWEDRQVMLSPTRAQILEKQMWTPACNGRSYVPK